MNKMIFLVGCPGSGKDIIIREVLSKYDIQEFKVEQVIHNIKEGYDFSNTPIVISTVSYDYDKICLVKSIFESNGYDCAMIFVNISKDVMLERLESRNLNESKLIEKYDTSCSNIDKFKSLFENFILFNNDLYSSDGLKNINTFYNVFVNLSGSIMESVKKKSLKNYSIKDKLSSIISKDNVSTQTYPTNDPGFPTAMGGIGDGGTYSVGSRYRYTEDTDFGGEVNVPSFASPQREIVPMQSYPQNMQNIEVRKLKPNVRVIKTIAKDKFKEKTHE